MYIMSNVIYELENGEIVRTLKEAIGSNMNFIKKYETINEEFEVPKERKYKRRIID